MIRWAEIAQGHWVAYRGEGDWVFHPTLGYAVCRAGRWWWALADESNASRRAESLAASRQAVERALTAVTS